MFENCSFTSPYFYSSSPPSPSSASKPGLKEKANRLRELCPGSVRLPFSVRQNREEPVSRSVSKGPARSMRGVQGSEEALSWQRHSNDTSKLSGSLTASFHFSQSPLAFSLPTSVLLFQNVFRTPLPIYYPQTQHFQREATIFPPKCDQLPLQCSVFVWKPSIPHGRHTTTWSKEAGVYQPTI